VHPPLIISLDGKMDESSWTSSSTKLEFFNAADNLGSIEAQSGLVHRHGPQTLAWKLLATEETKMHLQQQSSKSNHDIPACP
jgi:hypothetical protein